VASRRSARGRFVASGAARSGKGVRTTVTGSGSKASIIKSGRHGSSPRSRVTIDFTKLDDFLSSVDKLTRIVIRVGILEGRTRYPPRRRHDPADTARLQSLRKAERPTTRLAAIRRLSRQLKDLERREGAKAARKAESEIRRQFREKGLSSKGLRRRSQRGKGTAVARVAGVHQSGTSYHTAAFDRRRPAFRRELAELERVMREGRAPGPLVKAMGERYREEVRRSIDQLELKESGLLRRSVDFEIVDRVATAFRRRVARQRRAAIRGRRSRSGRRRR
jgi:hypothetical protein